MRVKQAAPVLLLLLAAALVAEGSIVDDPVQAGVRLPLRTPHHARHILAAPQPLHVKVYWGEGGTPSYLSAVTADIAAVNDFAVANNQQGLAFDGTVDSSQIEAELSAGSIDILLVYTYKTMNLYGPVFSTAVQAALETALANGNLKKLMVWHAWNMADTSSGVPGVSADAGCTSWNQWDQTTYSMYPNAALYSHAGPNEAYTQSIDGVPAAYWHCDRTKVTSLLRSATIHTWMAGNENDVTAFSFCEGKGSVFYSSNAMDMHWIHALCDHGDVRRFCQFHANAMYVFIYNIKCSVAPPTCPPTPVLSSSWLPPNNKMTRVSIAAVPTFDPQSPGSINITGVQYFDSTTGKQPVLPLAQWFSSGAADKAWVSLKAQRNGAGKGRLYRIQYIASNEAGSCSGVAYVCVPHDASAFDPLTQEEQNAMLGVDGITTAVVKRKTGCPDPAVIDQWMSTKNA